MKSLECVLCAQIRINQVIYVAPLFSHTRLTFFWIEDQPGEGHGPATHGHTC